MSSNNKEVEGIISEILSLAKRKPLKGEDLSRAKDLLGKLREMGFTNREISDLTSGGWSESTVKLYTRGLYVKDPSPKQETLKLLTQLVNMGLTLRDVESSVLRKEDLDAKGVSFQDISSLLEEAKKSKLGLKELVKMYRDMKDSKLSASQLSEALSYSSDLMEAGFTLEGLSIVYEASKIYGGYTSVFEAITSFGSLKTIEAAAERVGSEKKALEKQAGELKENVEELERRKAKVEEALKSYEELKSLGFNEAALKELKLSSDKYGGMEDLLGAVNTHINLVELQAKVNKLEKECSDQGSNLNKIQADHAHLLTVIDMCNTLLYKYKFSIPAITDIYEMAKKFGEPIEVLKAIGRYGELKAVEGDIEKLFIKKNELEARVKELEKQRQDLKVIIEEMTVSVRGLLKPLASEIERGATSMKETFGGAIQNIGATYLEGSNMLKRMYEEYANKYGELKAEAGKFEEDLRLIRIINTIVKYPSEAKELPFDYAILLQGAVYKFCLVKGLNPKVKAGDEISQKYYHILSTYEVELKDLISWTMRGLVMCLG